MSKKTYNQPGMVATKARLREELLESVKEPRVFDAFCGPVGAMHRMVWRRAVSYLGCDLEWSLFDNRRRIVCDTMTAVRHVELGAFNIFDVDAFGSPWGVVDAIMKRRAVRADELIGLAVTDGSSLKTRWGGVPENMKGLVRVRRGAKPLANFNDAIRVVLKKHRLRALWCKTAESGTSSLMVYASLLIGRDT